MYTPAVQLYIGTLVDVHSCGTTTVYRHTCTCTLPWYNNCISAHFYIYRGTYMCTTVYRHTCTCTCTLYCDIQLYISTLVHVHSTTAHTCTTVYWHTCTHTYTLPRHIQLYIGMYTLLWQYIGTPVHVCVRQKIRGFSTVNRSIYVCVQTHSHYMYSTFPYTCNL